MALSLLALVSVAGMRNAVLSVVPIGATTWLAVMLLGAVVGITFVVLLHCHILYLDDKEDQISCKWFNTRTLFVTLICLQFGVPTIQIASGVANDLFSVLLCCCIAFVHFVLLCLYMMKCKNSREKSKAVEAPSETWKLETNVIKSDAESVVAESHNPIHVHNAELSQLVGDGSGNAAKHTRIRGELNAWFDKHGENAFKRYDLDEVSNSVLICNCILPFIESPVVQMQSGYIDSTIELAQLALYAITNMRLELGSSMTPEQISEYSDLAMTREGAMTLTDFKAWLDARVLEHC